MTTTKHLWEWKKIADRTRKNYQFYHDRVMAFQEIVDTYGDVEYDYTVMEEVIKKHSGK